jgi:hypothetical protein
LTCSSCHSSVDGAGRLLPGVPNQQLDLGKAKDDYVNMSSLYSAWGPGREDIAAGVSARRWLLYGGEADGSTKTSVAQSPST